VQTMKLGCSGIVLKHTCHRVKSPIEVDEHRCHKSTPRKIADSPLAEVISPRTPGPLHSTFRFPRLRRIHSFSVLALSSISC
jgi:hypothetical protein